jgi:adenylate cyclase
MNFRSPPSGSRQDIAPWEETGAPDSQRNDSSFDTHTSLSHTNAQWAENLRPSQMPSSIFDNDFYNDSSENLDQISPGFAPDRGMTFPGEADHRRPSVASNLTISSNGSMGSRRERMHKKLQGIFGEEFPGVDDATSRQNSETSSLKGNGSLAAFLPNVLARGRNNSMNDAMRRSRPPSPTLVSRPRTPAPPPSSEVTPWEFQDAMVGKTSVSTRH